MWPSWWKESHSTLTKFCSSPPPTGQLVHRIHLKKETLYNYSTYSDSVPCVLLLLITHILLLILIYCYSLRSVINVLTSPSCTQGLNYFWQTDQLLRTPVLKSAMSNTIYFRYSPTAPLMLWEDASVSCYFYAAFIERERRVHPFILWSIECQTNAWNIIFCFPYSWWCSICTVVEQMPFTSETLRLWM